MTVDEELELTAESALLREVAEALHDLFSQRTGKFTRRNND